MIVFVCSKFNFNLLIIYIKLHYVQLFISINNNTKNNNKKYLIYVKS